MQHTMQHDEGSRLGAALLHSTYLDVFGSWLTMFLAKASEPFLLIVALWTAASSILPWLTTSVGWMTTVNGLALSVGLEGSIPGAFILARDARRAEEKVEAGWYLAIALLLFALAIVTLANGAIVERFNVTLPAWYSGGLLVLRCLLALSFCIVREVFKRTGHSHAISQRDLETNLATIVQQEVEKLLPPFHRTLQQSLENLQQANAGAMQRMIDSLQRATIENSQGILTQLTSSQEATLARMEQMSIRHLEAAVSQVTTQLRRVSITMEQTQETARLATLKRPPAALQSPAGSDLEHTAHRATGGSPFKAGIARSDVAGYIAQYRQQEQRLPTIKEVMEQTGCVYNTAKHYLLKCQSD